MEFPSKVFSNAVSSFSKLPGIGKKTALRMVLHLSKLEKNKIIQFASNIQDLANFLLFCEKCGNISDTVICEICNSVNRNHSTICIVQDIKDIIAIENTGQYNGVYHVLGGIINPIEGIGPDDINMAQLIDRFKNDNISELIFALPATIEGDTTCFYINKMASEYKIKCSTISRGISVGGAIEYADEVTLGRSIINRTNFNNNS